MRADDGKTVQPWHREVLDQGVGQLRCGEQGGCLVAARAGKHAVAGVDGYENPRLDLDGRESLFPQAGMPGSRVFRMLLSRKTL